MATTYSQQTSVRERISNIDFMRFVAISLVVLGHSLRGIFFNSNQTTYADYAIFRVFDYFLYTFHVPVFFVISGYLVASKIFDERIQTRRIVKLIKIYLLWFYLNALASIIFANYINRDIDQRGVFSVLNPLNPGSIMWFLLALIAANIIFLISQNRPVFSFIVAALSLICLIFQFDYSGIAYGTFWFFVGVSLPSIQSQCDRWQPWAMIWPAAGTYLFAASLGYYFDIPTTANVAACAAALLALFAAGKLVHEVPIITWIGSGSLAIYVMHIFFVAGTRILLVKVLKQDDLALLIVTTTLAGILAPLFLLAIARKTGTDRILMLA